MKKKLVDFFYNMNAIIAKKVKTATIADIITTTCRSVRGRLYVSRVTMLRRCSEIRYLPSNCTPAFFFTKKTVSSMRTELKTYGRIEINREDFRSVITAKAAIVKPIANEPVLPTNSLPWKLKIARMIHTINGPIISS